MRLLRRTLSDIIVFPRRAAAGSTGSVNEGFSDEPVVLRGNIGYVSNTLNSTANAFISTPMGVRASQVLKLRFMGNAAVNAGDGIMLPGDEGPAWRCVEVSRYPLMTLARIERMAGAGI